MSRLGDAPTVPRDHEAARSAVELRGDRTALSPGSRRRRSGRQRPDFRHSGPLSGDVEKDACRDFDDGGWPIRSRHASGRPTRRVPGLARHPSHGRRGATARSGAGHRSAACLSEASRSPPRRSAACCEDEFDAAFVERAIEEINRRYARQNRPYEIRQGEGGYRHRVAVRIRTAAKPRLWLRPQAGAPVAGNAGNPGLVAYRQPISRKQIEEIAKRNAGSALRQLVGARIARSGASGGNAGPPRMHIPHVGAVPAAFRRGTTRRFAADRGPQL